MYSVAGRENDGLQCLAAKLAQFLHRACLLLVGVVAGGGVVVGLHALLLTDASERGLYLPPIVNLTVLHYHGDARRVPVRHCVVVLVAGTCREHVCAANEGGGKHPMHYLFQYRCFN